MESAGNKSEVLPFDATATGQRHCKPTNLGDALAQIEAYDPNEYVRGFERTLLNAGSAKGGIVLGPNDMQSFCFLNGVKRQGSRSSASALMMLLWRYHRLACAWWPLFGIVVLASSMLAPTGPIVAMRRFVVWTIGCLYPAFIILFMEKAVRSFLDNRLNNPVFVLPDTVAVEITKVQNLSKRGRLVLRGTFFTEEVRFDPRLVIPVLAPASFFPGNTGHRRCIVLIEGHGPQRLWHQRAACREELRLLLCAAVGRIMQANHDVACHLLPNMDMTPKEAQNLSPRSRKRALWRKRLFRQDVYITNIESWKRVIFGDLLMHLTVAEKRAFTDYSQRFIKGQALHQLLHSSKRSVLAYIQNLVYRMAYVAVDKAARGVTPKCEKLRTVSQRYRAKLARSDGSISTYRFFPSIQPQLALSNKIFHEARLEWRRQMLSLVSQLVDAFEGRMSPLRSIVKSLSEEVLENRQALISWIAGFITKRKQELMITTAQNHFIPDTLYGSAHRLELVRHVVTSIAANYDNADREVLERDLDARFIPTDPPYVPSHHLVLYFDRVGVHVGKDSAVAAAGQSRKKALSDTRVQPRLINQMHFSYRGLEPDGGSVPVLSVRHLLEHAVRPGISHSSLGLLRRMATCWTYLQCAALVLTPFLDALQGANWDVQRPYLRLLGLPIVHHAVSMCAGIFLDMVDPMVVSLIAGLSICAVVVSGTALVVSLATLYKSKALWMLAMLQFVTASESYFQAREKLFPDVQLPMEPTHEQLRVETPLMRNFREFGEALWIAGRRFQSRFWGFLVEWASAVALSWNAQPIALYHTRMGIIWTERLKITLAICDALLVPVLAGVSLLGRCSACPASHGQERWAGAQITCLSDLPLGVLLLTYVVLVPYLVLFALASMLVPASIRIHATHSVGGPGGMRHLARKPRAAVSLYDDEGDWRILPVVPRIFLTITVVMFSHEHATLIIGSLAGCCFAYILLWVLLRCRGASGSRARCAVALLTMLASAIFLYANGNLPQPEVYYPSDVNTTNSTVLASDAMSNTRTSPIVLSPSPSSDDGRAPPLQGCSFETSYLCGWRRIGRWSWREGQTPTKETGPARAQDGDRHLYTEASDMAVGDVAVLQSPYFSVDTASGPCELRFYFHMWSTQPEPGVGNLTVEQLTNTSTNTWTGVWNRTGIQGDLWLPASAPLRGPMQETEVRFTVFVLGADSDIAVDNVLVACGPDPVPPPPWPTLYAHCWRSPWPSGLFPAAAITGVFLLLLAARCWSRSLVFRWGLHVHRPECRCMFRWARCSTMKCEVSGKLRSTLPTQRLELYEHSEHCGLPTAAAVPAIGPTPVRLEIMSVCTRAEELPSDSLCRISVYLPGETEKQTLETYLEETKVGQEGVLRQRPVEIYLRTDVLEPPPVVLSRQQKFSGFRVLEFASLEELASAEFGLWIGGAPFLKSPKLPSGYNDGSGASNFRFWVGSTQLLRAERCWCSGDMAVVDPKTLEKNRRIQQAWEGRRIDLRHFMRCVARGQEAAHTMEIRSSDGETVVQIRLSSSSSTCELVQMSANAHLLPRFPDMTISSVSSDANSIRFVAEWSYDCCNRDNKANRVVERLTSSELAEKLLPAVQRGMGRSLEWSGPGLTVGDLEPGHRKCQCCLRASCSNLPIYGCIPAADCLLVRRLWATIVRAVTVAVLTVIGLATVLCWGSYICAKRVLSPRRKLDSSQVWPDGGKSPDFVEAGVEVFTRHRFTGNGISDVRTLYQFRRAVVERVPFCPCVKRIRVRYPVQDGCDFDHRHREWVPLSDVRASGTVSSDQVRGAA